MNILIADDDAELCHLLKEPLEQEGMAVQTVPDGLSALVAMFGLSTTFVATAAQQDKEVRVDDVEVIEVTGVRK